ncbi:hypothetical protein FPANT_9823 [Fusarium pseudoanthophilum]|uniref:Uncharacterized protein n=1 Tax=Fusarium pseudoanthophilum TaxID=48495 RepID=A0A8H5KT69_9HYPO|nr:hypothetical protein FPANT_9823 [Fusarium pseudoanthophilum]
MEDDNTDLADCHAKWLERTESLVNSTNDCNITDERQTPKEWLEALTKLDFADPASVVNILDLLEFTVGKFILCTGKDAFTVSRDPGAMSVEEAPGVGRHSLFEGLLTLEFFRRSEARPAPVDEQAQARESSPAAQPLPSVVLPVGRLCKGYTTETGCLDTDETGYVLVVDAITPGHPVWLIYDPYPDQYEEQDDEQDEERLDRPASHEHDIYYAHPDRRAPVFKGIEKNFDAAQILPSITDWLESYGSLDFNQLEESIKATSLVGLVKAKDATLAYVAELLGQAQPQLVTDIMNGDEMSEKGEMSDARFAEIRAALGTPFQGKTFCPVSPYEYIRKVKEATAHDNSLDQYLRKAGSVSIYPPPQSGLEWLQKLAITDFANAADIYAHRRLMDYGKVTDFNLVANGKDDFCVEIYPRGLSYEEIDGEAHMALLSLETSALGAGKSLPKLILPVGNLVNANAYWRETGYAIVIDAVAPGHPVWLVYDRYQYDELDEERLIVDPTDARLVFEGIGHNFDAAQIFPSVQDWIKSYGNVDFAQIEDSIKATCLTGAVRAKEILLSEAQELFRQ